ncbi:MAG: TIGR04013 family B12-binding domain/radical SAM domain-containing protein [Promethearchaeota archaeon]
MKTFVHILYNNQNKYSWATLIGALEQAGLFESDNIELVLERNMEECMTSIKQVKESNLSIFMFSVNSFNYTAAEQCMKNINRHRRENNLFNSLFIIAGGPHASARPQELLDCGADLVFIKEGERSLPAFLIGLLNAKKTSNNELLMIQAFMEGVPNCFYRDQVTGATKFTFKGKSLDLDDLMAFAPKHRFFRPIEISRGCPHACSFCQTSWLFGGKMRHRSIDNVVYWTQKAVKLKFDKVWFTTPNAFAYGTNDLTPKPSKIESLLKKLSKINGLEKIFFGTFPAEVRPDFVTNDVLDSVIPYISNDRFIVGAQAASEKLLKRSHRGHDMADIWNAIDLITQRDFFIDIDMIFGLPGEDNKDIEKTIDFIKQVMKNGKVRIHGHVFMPLPGTPFENEKPGTLHDDLKAILGRFTSNGKVYGSYIEQELKAKKLQENRLTN